MNALDSIQLAGIEDPVRSKFAMTVPVIEATLYSLAKDRVARLGGIGGIRLTDLARELRAGDGDVGICFEYAVHDAIARDSPLIAPLASEILEKFCSIRGGAQSILFGPEKDGVIPLLESVEDSLTEDARVYVGNRGQPPKLKRYIPKIINAFRRHEERNSLPRSINGLWKADLFLGNGDAERWVGTTVKINSDSLEGAQGLRIGIYPRKDQKDGPRKDEQLNLIRMPLAYDAAFMELFYESFFLTRAFLNADGRVPSGHLLPRAEDRFVCKELEIRRDFTVHQVVEALREMGQGNLLRNEPVRELRIDAALSESGGLDSSPRKGFVDSTVSVTPRPLEQM